MVRGRQTKMEGAMAMKVFSIKETRRNKCLAWDPKANGGKGAGVYTSDVTDSETGKVLPELCQKFGIAEADVRWLTADDLPSEYRVSAKEALRFHAKEAEMSADDTIWSLVVTSAMQTLANDSVRSVRPVTDKAKERATATLRKVLEAQGKTSAEVNAVLAALGA